MPYLGPRSFNTTPLTTSNLAFLNENCSKRANSSPSNYLTYNQSPFKQPNHHIPDQEQEQNISHNQEHNKNQLRQHQPLEPSLLPKNQISTSAEDLLSTKIQSEDLEKINYTESYFPSNQGMQFQQSSDDGVYQSSVYGSKLIATNPSNSTYSSESYKDSTMSSETSFTEDNVDNASSAAESFSYKTMIDLNEDDNKTVILSTSNDSKLLIPSSPLKAYNVVAVEPHTNQIHNKSFEDLTIHQVNQKNIPPLLRKKSGELIKSSLKLNLQRSNSMPNAKSVRFATRLENVKFFKKSEQPNAVAIPVIRSPSKLSIKKTKWDFDSSSCSSSENDDDDAEEEQDDVYHYSKDYNDSIDDVDDDTYYYDIDEVEDDENLPDYENDDRDNDSFKISQTWAIKSNDCPFNPMSLNFARLAKNNDVILESVKLNSSGNSLIGFVYAKNISFEKKLFVRLTNDNWNTFKEFDNSNYISSNHIFKYSDSVSNVYDKFSFIIKLDTLKKDVNDDILDLQFCIQYITNNVSYWDNNDSKNYKITLVKNKSNNSKSKSFSKGIISKTLIDLDDSNIKLKDNNNFKFDISKPQTDIKSLRTSNSFGLKKIKSESSLPLPSKSNYSLFNNSHSNTLLSSHPRDNLKITASPQSINEFFSLSSYNPTSSSASASKSKGSKLMSSKSLPASPALLASTGFNPVRPEINDYDHIIKKFCFFTTSDKSTPKDLKSNTSIDASTNNNSNKVNSNNHELINNQYTIDNFNFSKSQTSIDLY